MSKLHLVVDYYGLGLFIHHCEATIVVGDHANVESVLAMNAPGFPFVGLGVYDNPTS